MNVATGVKLPAGAGRSIHFTWPNFGVSRLPGNAPGAAGTYRQGSGTNTNGASFLAGGTGTQLYAVATQGAAPIALNMVAAADVSGIKCTFPFYPILDQLGNNPVGNPWNVFRFIVVARFPALGGAIPAGADLGLQILAANQTSLAGTRGGVQFGPIDAANIALQVRRVNGGGLTLNRQLTFAQAGVADPSKFNVWELRMSNASLSGGAQLKAFINGVQFGAAVDCGSAAAIFPAIDVGGGGFIGFCFNFIVGALGAGFAPYALQCIEWHMIVSATEDDAG